MENHTPCHLHPRTSLWNRQGRNPSQSWRCWGQEGKVTCPSTNSHFLLSFLHTTPRRSSAFSPLTLPEISSMLFARISRRTVPLIRQLLNSKRLCSEVAIRLTPSFSPSSTYFFKLQPPESMTKRCQKQKIKNFQERVLNVDHKRKVPE